MYSVVVNEIWWIKYILLDKSLSQHWRNLKQGKIALDHIMLRVYNRTTEPQNFRTTKPQICRTAMPLSNKNVLRGWILLIATFEILFYFLVGPCSYECKSSKLTNGILEIWKDVVGKLWIKRFLIVASQYICKWHSCSFNPSLGLQNAWNIQQYYVQKSIIR